MCSYNLHVGKGDEHAKKKLIRFYTFLVVVGRKKQSLLR